MAYVLDQTVIIRALEFELQMCPKMRLLCTNPRAGWHRSCATRMCRTYVDDPQIVCSYFLPGQKWQCQC